MPWETPSGQPVTARLFLTSRESAALNRNYVNRSVWKPALREAGIAASRDQGMHGGRHYYASVQLEAGTSIRALAEYLGHDDPGVHAEDLHAPDAGVAGQGEAGR